MTEKSLLLKCDFADRFFIVGTDFPAARVFDTATSALAAVVELPLRSRTVSLAALTLTSVAIGRTDRAAAAANVRSAAVQPRKAATAEQLVEDSVSAYTAAVGLSNGTLLLHDVRRDALVAHVQVSETQQPLVALQLCGGFVFCLAANNTLYAMRLADAAAGPCLRLRVQPDASSIAVTRVFSATAPDAAGGLQTYRVMVAGPTNALYEVRTMPQSGAESNDSSSNSSAQVHATKLLAFPSQGTTAEFAWVSDAPIESSAASLPAVTASAQDGVVRLWDLQYDAPSTANCAANLLHNTHNSSSTVNADSTAVVARCRRTLLCGQRILNVTVLPRPHEPRHPKGGSGSAARTENYIAVTTLTGSVLLWSLGEAMLPAVVEPMPLKPDVVLVSAVNSGRLLFGAIRAAQQGAEAAVAASSSTAGASSAEALNKLEVTLLRGRFAMPIFETKNIGAAVSAASAATTTTATTAAAGSASAARRTALATLALGVAGSAAVTVVELPLAASSAATLTEQRDVDYLLEHTTDAATSGFVVLDTVWAAHQQQVAAKASQSMSEAFKAPQLFHARSIQDLPVKQLTLEQRLQQVAREEAAAVRRRKSLAGADPSAAGDGDAADGRSVLSHHALGLATIPLYQALHANDTSAVMDLLNMSSRSAEGMRATVLSLQLPYCLQLLQVIAERLGIVSKAVEKAVAQDGRVTNAGPNSNNNNNNNNNDNAAATAENADKTGNTNNNSGAESGTAVTAQEGVLRGGVAAFSIRSSLLEWIDAIVNYRGSELLAVQREWTARAARKAAGLSTPEDDAADAVSPPKDFLAPILHHYHELCAQYDKLAVLYGRLSTFKAVRPSQKNEFTNVPRQNLSSNVEMARPASKSDGSGLHQRRLHLSEKSSVIDSDIFFPVMFKESRSRAGHQVVRVRSKLEIAKRRQARENKDAALHQRARAAAQAAQRAKAAKGSRSILDDDDDNGHGDHNDVLDQIMREEMRNGDGELDLDALEAMDLADNSGEDGSDTEGFAAEEEEEEEESDAEDETASPRRRRGKTARADTTDEMIADDQGGAEEEGEEENSDGDAGLDSSEAEFSSASDDEVRSDVLDDGDSGEEEEGDEEDEEEEDGSERDDDAAYSDGEGSMDEDDDGMGEEMRELLTRHDDDDDRTERRKSKKVRTD